MSYCAECGQDHHPDMRDSGKTAEVRIAEINAKRDIEVARIQRGEAKTAGEAEIVVAEIEAEAGVEAAEAVADALTDVLTPPQAAPEPEPEPVVIEDNEPEAEASIEPAETSEPEPPHRHKAAGWFA